MTRLLVAAEGLRCQRSGILQFAQLIGEVALEAGAVLALEVLQSVDLTLEAGLLALQGAEDVVALLLSVLDDLVSFGAGLGDELVAGALTFGDVLVVQALGQRDEAVGCLLYTSPSPRD